MKLHRFLGKFDIKRGNLILKDQDLVNQIRNVLKIKPGERIILCDGEKNEGTAEIKEYEKNTAKVEITETGINTNESDKKVMLYCSILKKENFELVVQKATEIGVSEIVPVITARTVKLDIRRDRLKKIIKEAAEQSGRGIVPALHEPEDFKDAVKSIHSESLNLFFDQTGSDPYELKAEMADRRLISVFIGPEGGWTSEEIRLSKDREFNILNLGKTTLRAETAAITALFSVINIWR